MKTKILHISTKNHETFQHIFKIFTLMSFVAKRAKTLFSKTLPIPSLESLGKTKTISYKINFKLHK